MNSENKDLRKANLEKDEQILTMNITINEMKESIQEFKKYVSLTK